MGLNRNIKLKLNELLRKLSGAEWALIRTIIAKGSQKTTTLWIWALHADAHDFAAALQPTRENKYELARKVLASNLAHLSVVLFWISGMHFHGAYFSNYIAWIKDPLSTSPTSQYVWEVVSQGSINAELGGFSQGLHITSGLFNVWIGQGIISLNVLKGISSVGLLGSLILLISSYLHMHVSIQQSSAGLYKKLKTVLPHHLSIMAGLGSLSWSGHEIHIANPTLKMLEWGIEPGLIPSGRELLSKAVFENVAETTLYIKVQKELNTHWCSLEPSAMALHH